MIGNNGQKAVTSVDVAKLAGVSQSTVSRTFSSDTRLSKKTMQKVFQAAKALGYQPNAIAQSLASAKTSLIGIVKGYTVSPIYDDMLSEFTYLLQSSGKQVLYFEGRRLQSTDDVLWSVLKYQIQGLILLYAVTSSDIIVSCQQRNIPVLQMLRYSTNNQANVVLADNVRGTEDAIDHLLERGYRDFVYLAGDANSFSNVERQLTFMTKMQRLGIGNPIVIEGDYFYESGRAGMVEAARHCRRPCGVVAGSDMIALGALDAIRYDLGCSVPGDFGVIGFDDIPMAAWPTYSLTTMRQPTLEMVRDGLEIFTRNIDDRSLPPQVKKYTLELVKRGST